MGGADEPAVRQLRLRARRARRRQRRGGHRDRGRVERSRVAAAAGAPLGPAAPLVAAVHGAPARAQAPRARGHPCRSPGCRVGRAAARHFDAAVVRRVVRRAFARVARVRQPHAGGAAGGRAADRPRRGPDVPDAPGVQHPGGRGAAPGRAGRLRPPQPVRWLRAGDGLPRRAAARLHGRRGGVLVPRGDRRAAAADRLLLRDAARRADGDASVRRPRRVQDAAALAPLPRRRRAARAAHHPVVHRALRVLAAHRDGARIGPSHHAARSLSRTRQRAATDTCARRLCACGTRSPSRA